MKVYLASTYRNKDQIKNYATELQTEGVIITSTWLDEPHKPTDGPQDLPYEQNQKYAIRDIKDVLAADIFVLWTDPTQTIVRQGRTVELGVVLGINQISRTVPILVVGEEMENIFHYLPEVIHFPSWEKTKERILELARIERV